MNHEANGPQSADTITIEVAYALPGEQYLARIEVPVGTTARAALACTDLRERFAGLNTERCPLGIFGRVVPDYRVLRAGDRVEIYRPLMMGPREARRQRAAAASRRAS